MNVLSLFDGISCGQLALERAGIEINKYYASEIDKYAIEITQKNYPNTIQLGDISNIKGKDLPKIDLVIGGSPCQGFSFAGKQLNFIDPRSRLFFEYVRILEEAKPKYFLLENVKMKKEYQDIITKYLGVGPVEINSSLVSAQNRKRLYWTNIPYLLHPQDKGIMLKDIVLDDVMPVALHNLYGGFNEKAVRVFEEKSPTLRTAAGGGHIPSFVNKTFGCAIRGRYKEDGSTHQVMEPNGTEKANALTTVQKDSMKLVLSKKALEYMDREVKGGRNHWDFKHHSDINNDKSATVVANFFKGVPYNVFKDWNCIRKFHPVECERLQTLPDNYTEGVSDTQRYKMIGNGWTVDVPTHFFKGLTKTG